MTKNTRDIIHITDCHDTNEEGGGLAAIKVKLRYSHAIRNSGISAGLIEVMPAEEFNTIDVGAKFSELVTSHPNPADLIVAINTAPPSIPGGNDNNERKNFVLGKLKNGLVFGGTWGGHCLSYVKSEIAELYELTDSNNGSQFRSLEVLPDALVKYAAGTIDKSRLEQVHNIETNIPDAPSHSHVYAIDNFKNAKIYISPEDRRALKEAFEQAAQNNQNPSVEFGFGDRSIEFGLSETPSVEFNEAALAKKMFNGGIGNNIVSLTSSSKALDSNGEIVDVPQIATIRDEPDQALGFPLPKVGTPVYFQKIGGQQLSRSL